MATSWVNQVWNPMDVGSVDQPLLLPISWQEPRRVLLVTDVFSGHVPDDLIAQVLAVIAATPEHTYRVPTQWPDRLRPLVASQAFCHVVARHVDGVRVEKDHDPVERWAPIPGFAYEASSHGRVRSPRKILKQTLNPVTGRLQVTLWRANVPTGARVHRLVLLAHAPDREAGTEVCHRNGEKLDNRLANLRWGTTSENQYDRSRHGRRSPTKLTYEQVATIRTARRDRTPTPSQGDVAAEFGISRSLVSMIESGRRWSQPEVALPPPNMHVEPVVRAVTGRRQ